MARKSTHTLGARAKPYIDRIENVDKGLATRYAEYLAEKKDLQEDRKAIIAEAREAGVLPRALKDFLKKRRLKVKISDIGRDLDPDEAQQFQQLELELDEPDFIPSPTAPSADSVLETLTS